MIKFSQLDCNKRSGSMLAKKQPLTSIELGPTETMTAASTEKLTRIWMRM
jgi:hypothetical protein